MDKTPKDDEGSTERTGLTNQDGKFNSEDGRSHSSLTYSATTIEGDNILERSFRFMLYVFVFSFLFLLVFVVLVIVLFQK